MLDENDMRKAIDTLKKDISISKINKSSLLLSIILTAIGLIGSGVLLGAVFGQMGLAVTMGVIACIPVLATKVKEFEEVSNDIKYSEHQIATYEKDIADLQEKRAALTNPTPKKTTGAQKKYSYDRNKKESPKKEDVKIEFFDERDFDDEPKPKSR